MMDPRKVSHVRGRLPCRTCRMAMGLDAPESAPSVAGSSSSDTDATDAVCPCVVSIAIMRELGMTHAANMHAQAAGEGGGAPTVRSVELHMGDEEGTLFPTLRQVARTLKGLGASADADRLERNVTTLEAQHGKYRSEWLAKGLVPPPEVLGPHGMAEDRIVSEFADLIRLEWERMRKAGAA